MSGIINVALSELEFEFKKGISEELRIIVNDIRERCERVQAEFEANFDRTEDKYVILADEFREYFRKKGFVPQSTQDAKESIDYMDSVMKKIREINRRNNILKKKYQGDERFVRIHKRIEEENEKREKPIISKAEYEIAESLSKMKREIDNRIYLDINIIANENSFKRDTLAMIGHQLIDLGINASISDRKFINNLIANEYINQYNQVHSRDNMDANTQNISEATIALIDSLKSTTSHYGLANSGSEYKIITEMFLYKYFNDKFGYEAKRDKIYGERLSKADKWDAEYDKFTEEEVEDLFSYLPASVPLLKPEHTLAHLYNTSGAGDFSTRLDATLIDIANLNADTFSVVTSGKSRVNIFSALTQFVTDPQKRDDFARSLMSSVASFNFESVFAEKYDFFSRIFEYLIKDYNNAGGGKYAEYYTPRAIAQVMARLLVGDNADLRGMTCYDPSAGTGTLLMALAHQIGEDRCTIFSQDISEKSSEMLRLNLILNNLSGSLPNVVQGNTLTEPYHKEENGALRKFDFVVSNPPFNLDFSDFRDTLASDTVRFWAGVPSVPAKKKESMSIYLCFIQHLINSLKTTGKGAIVIPTGFITAKSGVERKVLTKIIDNHWVYGCISMPSNVFANTGTNVSVLFFDKSASADKVILIDASKLGEEYKEGKNKKRRLLKDDIDLIVNTFKNKEAVEDFSVAVSYDEIKDKGYSLSAGQYFDIKINYVDITEEEFNSRMAEYRKTLSEQFAESHRLEEEIMKQLDALHFNVNVGNNE